MQLVRCSKHRLSGISASRDSTVVSIMVSVHEAQMHLRRVLFHIICSQHQQSPPKLEECIVSRPGQGCASSPRAKLTCAPGETAAHKASCAARTPVTFVRTCGALPTGYGCRQRWALVDTCDDVEIFRVCSAHNFYASCCYIRTACGLDYRLPLHNTTKCLTTWLVACLLLFPLSQDSTHDVLRIYETT